MWCLKGLMSRVSFQKTNCSKLNSPTPKSSIARMVKYNNKKKTILSEIHNCLIFSHVFNHTFLINRLCAKIVKLLGLCNESFFWEDIVDHQPAQPTNQFIMGHHQPVRLEYLTSLYTAIYQNFLMISFQGWSYFLTMYDRTYIYSGLNKKMEYFS